MSRAMGPATGLLLPPTATLGAVASSEAATLPSASTILIAALLMVTPAGVEHGAAAQFSEKRRSAPLPTVPLTGTSIVPSAGAAADTAAVSTGVPFVDAV